jgi:hypothetical protein
MTTLVNRDCSDVVNIRIVYVFDLTLTDERQTRVA